MIRTFRFTACLLAAIAIAIASGPARAQEIIVDQEAFTTWWGYSNIRFLGPIGQEFVPVQRSIDVVEIWIGNGLSFEDGELIVYIHEDSISGTTIGMSATKTIAKGAYVDAVRFPLVATVPVQPGALYVWEVRWVAGSESAMVYCDNSLNIYPRGRAVILGSPANNTDHLFRVGMIDRTTRDQSVSWGELKTRYRR